MNKSTLRNLALGLAVVALALAPAMAQMGAGPGHRGPGHGQGGPGMMMGKMADALDLTADQRAQIRQIRAKYMAGALGNHMDTMREARANLRIVVHDMASTDDQVRAAADAVAKEVAALAVEGHRMAAEISAVLTPEQRAKAADLRKQWRAQRRGGPPLDEVDEF